MLSTVRLMTRYKIWASELIFQTVSELPGQEAERPRATRFGSMVHTLNHIYVVEDIFRHHLEFRPHDYTARNTETPPPLDVLWDMQREMDAYYTALVEGLDEDSVAEAIDFAFVSGGAGRMSRGEILLHLANHGTYHRGFVTDMMYQIPVTPPASDLPVFLRDVEQAAAA